MRNNGFRLITILKTTSSNGFLQHVCRVCCFLVSTEISCHSTFSVRKYKHSYQYWISLMLKLYIKRTGGGGEAD